MKLVTKGYPSDYSIDDLHQASTAEFDDDPQALAKLNAAYVEAQSAYLFTLMTIRSEKASQQ